MALNTENPLVIASRFINNTRRHVFLTGKAGTGKTTFLREVFNSTHKKCVVAAPTGVAAINAGGVTLHSLLQLPFGSFIPSNDLSDMQGISTKISTPASIVKEQHMSKRKLILLREIELLIIDEVSMLRADLLDAIDFVLRFARRSKEPFGGLQILFIGDLLQLPPVVKDHEWQILSRWYNSPYFFEAKALKDNPPVYIELEKIFRQSDPEFIGILNNFRYNRPTQIDLDLLNATCKKLPEVENRNDYIFITTHNRIVDDRNSEELSKLKNDLYTYSAEIEGDFPEHLYPVEYVLQLKEGARVMFIKNDYSGNQLYFNGKLGTVLNLDENEIEVEFDDDSENVMVEKYTWENKTYSVNTETGEITEQVTGAFRHYPLRLAWAVTVHKSQGLTFPRAILDLSGAFAPGQIYVALSRLQTLEGLVLASPLFFNRLRTDKVVLDYAENKKESVVLLENLKTDIYSYTTDQAVKAFDLSDLQRTLKFHHQSYDKDENKSLKQKHKKWASELYNSLTELKEVADKFIKQVNFIVYQAQQDGLQPLQERMTAARGYFEPRIKEFVAKVLQQKQEVKNEGKKVKTYLTELMDLEMSFLRQIYLIHKACAVIATTIGEAELSRKNFDPSGIYADRKEQKLSPAHSKESKAKTKVKSEPASGTREISFQMFSKGMTVKEIAAERHLAVSTIEGHLVAYIADGKVDVTRLVAAEKLAEILKVAEDFDHTQLKPIKEILGDDYSYAEIRLALAGRLRDRAEAKSKDAITT